MFGFTLGSDTENAGARGVALENIARFGKRASSYRALGQKLEFAYGLTNDFSASVALLSDYHRVRARPLFVGSVDSVSGRYLFNGVGGEIRYRFLDRKQAPFGLTLHVEPALALSDELSGLRGRKLGFENKLILDQGFAGEAFFLAVNFLHELEVVKERGSKCCERASRVGASVAASARLTPGWYAGVEARYLRAYEGLSFGKYLGDAVYVGPTLSARIGERAWVSASWNTLIAGRARGGGLDLDNFERRQVRLKLGVEF